MFAHAFFLKRYTTFFSFEGKLYIQTGKVKEVSKQIHANPNVEISAFDGTKWIRIAGEMKADDNREAKKHMLDNYPSLRGMYNEEDDNTEVFCFTSATATFYSFTEASKVICF